MQLSTMELLIVSVGLSIDVFVAVAYMGAGFSKIRWKNLVLLSVLFGGIQLGAQLLQVGDGLVDIALGGGEVSDCQHHQLSDRHACDVCRVVGQIVHGRSPHWYARAKVE